MAFKLPKFPSSRVRYENPGPESQTVITGVQVFLRAVGSRIDQ